MVVGVPPAAFKYKVIQEYPSLQLNGWKVSLLRQCNNVPGFKQKRELKSHCQVVVVGLLGLSVNIHSQCLEGLFVDKRTGAHTHIACHTLQYL